MAENTNIDEQYVKYIKIGKSFGLIDEPLIQFVEKKVNEDLARDERAKERDWKKKIEKDLEKAKIEAETARDLRKRPGKS